MGFYSPKRQNVNIEFNDRFELREEVDSLLEDIQEGQMQNHIDNVMMSPMGKRIIKGLLEEGYSRREVEQMFLEAAKKSKKKKKEESSKKSSKDSDDIDVDDVGNSSDIPDSSDSDDDKDSKKKDKKSKKSKGKDKDSKDDDSSSDDIDLDTDSDDSEDSDDDDKDSKKKDKKSKKKDKDSDDDIDDSSIEDKSSSSKSKKDKKDDSEASDDKDSKKKAKKSKDKDKDSKDDDSGSDDLKLEQVDYNVFTVKRSYKPNYRDMLETAMDKEYNINNLKECGGSCSSGSKKNTIKNGKQRIKEMKEPVKEDFTWRLPPGYEPPLKNKYWDKIVMEHFDMTDNKTRVVLITCDEDAQSEVLHSLTDRLYDVIVDKSATIDYGMIDETRGDIQSLQNYGKLEECVELLHQLLIEYKQDTNPVDEIKMAMDNLANRTDMFKKCYMSKVDFGILTYETMTLAVIASTSLMLSTSVEFIKSANDENFQIILDRTGLAKAKNHLLFTNLKRFNVMCADKSFDKTMDTILIEYGKNLLGLSTMSGLAVAALVTVILYNFLPMLRELTYFFYYTRTRVSDYFNIQADLLEMNAHDIEVNQKPTVGDRKTVVKRQRAIAEKFRSIANFFMVDFKQAEQKATTDINRDRQKLKTDDVMDDVPDNSKSALF